MTWWFYELLGSLRFLSATGQEGFWRSKRVYELVIPAVVAGVGTLGALFFPDLMRPDTLKRLADGLFQFMVFVVPFHLAALAAVATFTRPQLDLPLKGSDVTLRVWDNLQGEYFLKTLTLRQYTCLLFGSLCSIGMAFILVYVVASGLNLPWLFGCSAAVIERAAVFLLVFYLAHYGTLTIYAVTFLFDKVSEIESR